MTKPAIKATGVLARRPRKDAANYLTISVPTFDRLKKLKNIKPNHTIGARGHRYAQDDLDTLQDFIISTRKKHG